MSGASCPQASRNSPLPAPSPKLVRVTIPKTKWSRASGNCLARPDPVFQGEIEGSPLHMPKIGPWWRKKPLISWEKLGVDALNNYGERILVQRLQTATALSVEHAQQSLYRLLHSS